MDGDRIDDVCDPDRDGDLAWNDDDNCSDLWNPDQEDQDGDGFGDVCDTDLDDDGIENGLAPTGNRILNRGSARTKKGGKVNPRQPVDPKQYVYKGDDNCPFDANPDQSDRDGDGKGDVCDDFSDPDGDNVTDADDNCPDDANPGQADADGDGVGDVCEPPPVINEVDEIEIDAATEQELIDAILISNAGERVEADESITKFSRATINLTSAHYLFTEPVDADGKNRVAALPEFDSPVTINGGGATLERDPNADALFRFIYIPGSNAQTVTLNDITFVGGGGTYNDSFEGGALWARSGALTFVNRCAFLNNEVTATQASGGGVWSETGDIVVINTTFTGNSATGTAPEADGGVHGGAAAQNRATGRHQYINCTIVGNHTDGDGGALSIKEFVSSMGDLISADAHLVQNTILADNTGGNCDQVHVHATSNGFNVIDNGTCSWATDTGDQVDVADPIVDALVGSTFLPADSGPAIDVVPDTACIDHEGNALAADQRGELRPNGAGCDAGAAER